MRVARISAQITKKYDDMDRPADNLFINRTIMTDGHSQLQMIDT